MPPLCGPSSMSLHGLWRLAVRGRSASDLVSPALPWRVDYSAPTVIKYGSCLMSRLRRMRSLLCARPTYERDGPDQDGWATC